MRNIYNLKVCVTIGNYVKVTIKPKYDHYVTFKNYEDLSKKCNTICSKKTNTVPVRREINIGRQCVL